MSGDGIDSRPYYTVPELADGLGWTRQRARRWLRRAGLLEYRLGRWLVSEERLIQELPELYRHMREGSSGTYLS